MCCISATGSSTSAPCSSRRRSRWRRRTATCTSTASVSPTRWARTPTSRRSPTGRSTACPRASSRSTSSRSAAVIISDVEAKCFHLYPSFFDRARREQQVVTFPDRLEAIKKYVHGGGGLMMLGGWLSFSGRARWGAGGVARWPRRCRCSASSARTSSSRRRGSRQRSCSRTTRSRRACRGGRSRRSSGTMS